MARAYLGGVGRTPRVKLLAISPDGTQVKVQELNKGNPMELQPSSQPVYWTRETDLYAKLKITRGGGGFHLTGQPNYNGLPVETPA